MVVVVSLYLIQWKLSNPDWRISEVSHFSGSMYARTVVGKGKR